MLDAWLEVVSRVDPTWFAVSAVLFGLGYLASYPVVRLELDLLTWYPLWVWSKVKEWVDPDGPWLRLFAFLLCFNSVSLLANFLSGFLVVLPFAFAVLLGLNVGVIAVEEAGLLGLVGTTLLNPVAWIELPAAFVSLAIGVQLGGELLAGGPAGAAAVFVPLLEVYVFVVLPLLFVAALLESTLIWLLPTDGRPGVYTDAETAGIEDEIEDDVEDEVVLEPGAVGGDEDGLREP